MSVPLLFGALSSCAPSVRLNQPDVRLPASFETAPAPAPIPAAPLDTWWRDFHDPQLTSLVSTALARSTTIRLAYARIDEARAQRRQTRAGTLPSGGLSGSATERGSEAVWGSGVSQNGSESYQANFSPSWEIDLFGRLATIRKRADLDNAASTLDFYGVRLALAADVATALFRARSLAVQLDDAGEALRIARDLAKTADLGLAHGLTSGQDVARLQASVASNAAEVSRLAAALQSSKRSLLILVGTPDAPTESLEIERILDAPPAVPAFTPGMLLTRRPDVLAAEIDVQSAAATVKISRLALFPQFSIQAGAGLSATGGSNSGGTGIWSLIAGFAAPVLDRARLLAAMRVSEARGQQAIISYERAVQTAFGEAENALTSVAADERRTAELERAASSARTAFDAARKGYAAGLTDLTTLLQTEQTWRQNRSAFSSAKAALLVDTVNAIRAFGGGWNPDAQTTPEQQRPDTSGNP